MMFDFLFEIFTQSTYIFFFIFTLFNAFKKKILDIHVLSLSR